MQKVKDFLRERQLLLWQLLRIFCGVVLLYTAYTAVFFTAPVLNHQPHSAAGSWVGDTAAAHYDAGLILYAGEHYPEAIEELTAAYNALLSESGEISPQRAALAAQIKFLTGNALVKGKKPKTAVEAYKEALKLDPTHIYAKYNLEMLQSMNGGKGPAGDPNDPGGSGSGKPDRKGI